MKKGEYPMCRQELPDCFAYKNMKCTILRSTTFRYACPFYKHKSEVVVAQIEEAIKIYRGEKKQKGVGDVQVSQD